MPVERIINSELFTLVTFAMERSPSPSVESFRGEEVVEEEELVPEPEAAGEEEEVVYHRPRGDRPRPRLRRELGHRFSPDSKYVYLIPPPSRDSHPTEQWWWRTHFRVPTSRYDPEFWTEEAVAALPPATPPPREFPRHPKRAASRPAERPPPGEWHTHHWEDLPARDWSARDWSTPQWDQGQWVKVEWQWIAPSSGSWSDWSWNSSNWWSGDRWQDREAPQWYYPHWREPRDRSPIWGPAVPPHA